ncbi:E3 SUMO-protein ligase ZBED1-like isoform X2 [Apus apus]|uniref:E3 SUMO-protein ligase ZBED1-like isoform X2 n=1 Tax=Apus apus TaxID=8895 RepID=UPI0021F8FBD1|nr:E3 SUMO-protein ligase ZBED1-like isoform X2 [Apus apus]
MAEAGAPRGARLLPQGLHPEEQEAHPKEEPAEEPVLPLLPQPIPEDVALPFGPYGMAATSLGPARRKREKGGSQEGAGAGIYVDRRKSKVWNFYTKLGDAYVECNVCKKQLSFHNSTTTMREHLVRKHGMRESLLSQLKDEQNSELEPEGAAKRCRQPESGMCQPSSSSSESRSEVLLELVLEMIFRDLHPLSLVKDKGFGLLLGYLEPGWALPAREQLAGMLRRRYRRVREQLEWYLRTVETVVVCMELWGSQGGQTYLTLTANFIDREWRRARCALGTRPVPGQGAELEEKLQDVLSEFGLSGKSVFYVVHDAPGNVSQGEPQGWSSLCCAARALQLCVAAGLEVEQVQEALGIARGIIRYFQQDSKASCSLHSKLEAINKAKVKLVMDTASSWLSTAEMCENLLDLKWAIMSVLEEQPKVATSGVQNLADHQWKLLQDLVAILRPIRIATAFLCEEQNASISALMPCIHGVVAAIGQQAEEAGSTIRTVVSNIRAELRRRWGLEQEEEALENPAVIAAFLDPRFKELRFLSPGTRHELHQRLKILLSQVCAPPGPSQAKHEAEGSQERGAHHQERGALSSRSSSPNPSSPPSIYDILLGKDPTENMPEIHQQLENFLVEPLCRRSSDPLCWWRSHERRFPAVARLARRFLALPATAAAPRAAFAAGPGALEQRRALLGSEHLDQILFLHQNWDVLEGARRSRQAAGENLR